ncbi:MAG: hypothetical protein ACTSQY_06935, partial [Candidatus Odinarchaeia archaeon]
EYAQQNNVPIDFYELPRLRILADAVDIKLLLEGENPEKGIYEINDPETTKNKIIQMLTRNLISNPNTPYSLIQEIEVNRRLLPTYRVEYQIRHQTINSSGTLLYDVNENGILHISSDNLQIYDLKK